MDHSQGLVGRSLLITALLLTTGRSLALAPTDLDPSAREWNQAGGDAAWSLRLDVEPLLTAPAVAWRTKLPETLQCEPVTWGGILCLLLEQRNETKLHAYRIESGERLAAPRRVGRNLGPCSLATWNGVAVVGTESELQGFVLRGSNLAQAWKTRVAGGHRLRVHDGIAYCGDRDGVRGIDLSGGAEVFSTTALGNWSTLSILRLPEPGTFRLFGARLRTLSDVVSMSGTSLMRVSIAAVDVTGAEVGGKVYDNEVAAAETDGNRAPSIRFTVLPGEAPGLESFSVFSSSPFAVQPSTECIWLASGGAIGTSPLVDRPVILPLLAYGLDKTGGLLQFRGDTGEIVPGDQLPPTRRADLDLEEIESRFEAGTLVRNGDERPLLPLWQEPLRAHLVDDLASFTDELADQRLGTAALDILSEAKRWGLPSGEARKLEVRLAGIRDHSRAEAIRERLRPRETEMRRAAARRFVKGALWCQEHGFPTSAACLLADAERTLPGTEEVRAATLTYFPPGMPETAEEERPARWRAWAEELITSGGRFLAPDDPARARATGIWTPALALRTPHLLCFSLEDDPLIVGESLRYGERAIESIQNLFGPPADAPPPLDMRIHRDEEEYLGEVGRDNQGTAGVFDLDTKISRFFIPRRRLAGEVAGRNLFSTVAHELCHHYVDVVVEAGRTSLERPNDKAPGFWIVEGIADFVGDQTAHSVLAGLRLDDPTVPSLELSAGLEAQRLLVPASELVLLSRNKFSDLGREEIGQVAMRGTLQTVLVNPFTRFYAEANALTFFLLNRRGETGQEAYRQFLHSYYRGKSKGDVVQALGFSSAADLDAAFEGFLRGLQEG